ncbi:MAG: 2-hydroxyacid dehydrogenase [Thermoguttaceae bacterium]|nr:2-hydroxyacid dehydrogenase [Thermoguttaceae bacterium]MDW8079643.1 2-hydroxyacid dehydrogenase [Thermoguttaceae bacterium]
MRVAVFSTKPYDRQFLSAANKAFGHELVFFEPRLTRETCRLAEGFPAVCVFVNDELDAYVLLCLAKNGTKLVALRCAGFNNVDLRAAEELELTVTRVPAYSPQAVAEHTVALILALGRKLHKAYNRVREGNFALDGLLGFDLHRQTVGIIGTGKIGVCVAQALRGFGCRLLGYDPHPNSELEKLGLRYVPLPELFAESDIISLHCPLVPETWHLINEEAIAQMKRGVMIINTSRGALIDTRAAIRALKSGKIGAMGLDVYEEEADLFYENLSDQVIQDDTFARMLTFPNVIVTAHQAFFTRGAMEAIAQETLANISAFERGQQPPGLITTAWLRPATTTTS